MAWFDCRLSHQAEHTAGGCGVGGFARGHGHRTLMKGRFCAYQAGDRFTMGGVLLCLRSDKECKQTPEMEGAAGSCCSHRGSFSTCPSPCNHPLPPDTFFCLLWETHLLRGPVPSVKLNHLVQLAVALPFLQGLAPLKLCYRTPRAISVCRGAAISQRCTDRYRSPVWECCCALNTMSLWRD